MFFSCLYLCVFVSLMMALTNKHLFFVLLSYEELEIGYEAKALL